MIEKLKRLKKISAELRMFFNEDFSPKKFTREQLYKLIDAENLINSLIEDIRREFPDEIDENLAPKKGANVSKWLNKLRGR
ncbi:MAG TPA: hypothetical protein VMV36_05970 [Ignavibacteriaceae bacterium]|nr:hypothetical protein [Ignavibacteriaceae bacterium]